MLFHRQEINWIALWTQTSSRWTFHKPNSNNSSEIIINRLAYQADFFWYSSKLEDSWKFKSNLFGKLSKRPNWFARISWLLSRSASRLSKITSSQSQLRKLNFNWIPKLCHLLLLLILAGTSERLLHRHRVGVEIRHQQAHPENAPAWRFGQLLVHF